MNKASTDFYAGFYLATQDPKIYRLENKHLVPLEILNIFSLPFEDFFTPCLNACWNFLPRHVNTLFEDMFILCLNTCLRNVWKLVYFNFGGMQPPCLKKCMLKIIATLGSILDSQQSWKSGFSRRDRWTEGRRDEGTEKETLNSGISG